MSVTALITGKLIADPERRTGASGKDFVLAKVGTTTEEGDLLVSVIAFGSVAEQLAAMGKGDTVALNGRAKVTTWTGKDGGAKAGLSLTVDALLTSYHLRRRRAAMNQGPEDDGPGRGNGAPEGGLTPARARWTVGA
jgi:single-stranded DNA-binding protein